MVTNFDYLKNEPQFAPFANVAISAERIILIDAEASIMNSRRAMEFAVKWMYSVDKALEMPFQDNLQSLLNAEDYRQLVGRDLWNRMDYIRRCGNNVAHGNRKQGRDEAMLCLENLFIFLDYVACCYAVDYQERNFDKTLISARIEKAKKSREDAKVAREKLEKDQEKYAQQELDLKKLMEENASLKEALSARRQEQQATYVPKPLDLSEYETRKMYIDAMLTETGWTQGQDWINEVPLTGMPNKSGVGYADYVLYDDRHCPLAIIEAKRTCEDVVKGRQQAKLYADILEKEAESTELPCRIYLFQGLPKNDKMEWIIQKTVELGVYEVIPVAMKNCVVKLDDKKAKSKVMRWQAIAESAAKQSKRSLIPEVKMPMSYKEAVAYAKELDVKLVPYENEHGMAGTKAAMEQIKKGESIAVFIGPEGGFAPEEIALVQDEMQLISLGKRILRTETAGIAALAILGYQLESSDMIE